ncbi:MAG: response regulator, partial [Elusimicrobiota bacterium]|nr:response regulator [Elusimicrobiota bacterium]
QLLSGLEPMGFNRSFRRARSLRYLGPAQPCARRAATSRCRGGRALIAAWTPRSRSAASASRSGPSRVFSREGYVFTVAASVAEARRLMGANRYDLLITNLILGDGAGTELMEMGQVKGGATHFILVTGAIEEWEAPLFIEKYKLKECFRKPFKITSLLSVVKELLD